MHRAIALLVLVALAATAWADGKMFQRAIVAKPPVTPDQRALLAFDEVRGTETLVVETTVAGEGDQFAWVIPLPATPTIEASTTGLFPTLEVIAAPEVVSRAVPDWVGLAVLGIGLWATVRWWRRPLRAALAVAIPPVTFVVAIVAMFVVAPPGCGTLKLSADPRAQVISRQTVGVFDATTLTATDAPSLRRWLGDNGFAAPESIDPVVTDLLREGWVFVASKVRSDGGADTARRLHPLSFTFPTKQAVYPMRLTGVGAESIELELFVCGARRAEAEGLTTDFCEDGVASARRLFLHDEFRRRAGGADVLTKLSGRLDRAAMTRDVAIRWTDYAPARTEWHETGAAANAAATPGALAFAGVLLAAAIASRWIAACATRYFVPFDAKTFAIAVALGAAVTGVRFGSIPRVPDGAVVARRSGNDLHERLREPPDDVAGDAAAVRRWVEATTAGIENDFTGEAVREEDSPGNWSLREAGERLSIVCWDAWEVETVDVSRLDTFAGSVRTAEGAPVADGEIRIHESDPSRRAQPEVHFGADVTVRTDADGRFRARLRAGRTWDVAVAPAGHPYLLRENVDPRSGPLDVVLPRATSLRGRVVDQDGRPVVGAEIRGAVETPFSVGEERSAETDADGWFELRGLDAETGDLRVHVHVHEPPDCRAATSRRFRGRLPPEEPFVLVKQGAPSR